MAYFNVCPECGSNLDPGEVCDCHIKKCCICGDVLKGHGNNAMPVKDGRCCDRCNIITVVPAISSYQPRENCNKKVPEGGETSDTDA